MARYVGFVLKKIKVNESRIRIVQSDSPPGYPTCKVLLQVTDSFQSFLGLATMG